eukprot:tig00021537_g22279.t1
MADGVSEKVEKMQVADGKPAKPAKEKKAAPAKVELPTPQFVLDRIKLWDELKAKKAAAVTGGEIKITLPNGSVKTGTANKTTPLDIAREISKNLAEDAVVAKVDGKFHDMFRPLEKDCSLQIFTFDSEEGKHAFWHSSAHVLGQAMEFIYENCQLCIGPPIEEGFYYDAFLGDQKVSELDFPKLEELVNKIIKEKQTFERMELTKDEAREMFKTNRFKLDIINKKVPDGEVVSAYRSGALVDLCRGPHVVNTGKIKAFTVTKNSAAYWEGKAENDSLQRVYGVAFPSDKLMKEYKHRIEEAAKRDHRRLGLTQELFFFHELSPGSCFFLPNGARIYNKLVDFIRSEYRKRGFSEVITPNMYNFALWETSGHAKNYKDNMFIFEVEKQQFGLKPMNCPGHCLMFAQRARSYRELPLRLADFGVLHRNELSGTLTGLTRVRRFQQDDAHIFCAQDQIMSEIEGALGFMESVYGRFGFEFELRLSTRPENFLGDIEVWNTAEADLKAALDKFGKPWELNPGDGAFYGPKIDITVFDALKRRHQCATIQLDFQLPIRFNLQYSTAEAEGSGEQGRLARPVIIHRAILGSVERFIAILTEHCAGRWPFWVSPRQAIVIPVSEKFLDYAHQVHRTLNEAGFYTDLDATNRKLPKKVREAEIQHYNYILVVGEKEAADGTVAVRAAGGAHGEGKEAAKEEAAASNMLGVMSVADVVARFQDDVKHFR